LSKHHIAVAAVALAASGVAGCGSGGHKSAAQTGASSSGAPTGTTAGHKTYAFSAKLDVPQETPGPKDASGASGVLKATLTMSGKRGEFVWKLSLANLSSPAVTGWIDLAAPGKTGSPAIPLCAPCKRGAYGTYFGPFNPKSGVLKALLNGDAYANIQTKKNPSGEIRGQVRFGG
jgi:hypothetical protein